MTFGAGEWLSLAMLVVLAAGLFSGLPVAVVLIAVGLGFGAIGVWLDVLQPTQLGAIFFRIYGTLSDAEDIAYAAVPLLIAMGALLQGAGLANDLLIGIRDALPRVPAAPMLAVLIVGVVLAPMAGMIGASVSALAMLALPSLLAERHAPGDAGAVVAAAGTLGVVIPPGVLLFFVADGLSVQVPALYLAMLGPLALLFALYCLVAMRHARRARPIVHTAAAPSTARVAPWDLFAPLALFAGLVGLIASGWSTLSEGAALGVAGTLLIAGVKRRLNRAMLARTVHQTVLVTGIIFFIFVGASTFSLTFRLLGGADLIADGLRGLGWGGPATLAVIMAGVFLLGFFFDWLEIVLVTFPVLKQVLAGLALTGHIEPAQVAMVWVAVLMTLNLQTSFLTPPFGYALFLLKGAAPDALAMSELYRGIVPYVLAQVGVIVLVACFPAIATWLPNQMLDLSIPRAEKFNE